MSQSNTQIELVNRPKTRFNLPNLREIWLFRFLLYNLILRELRIRYKQTILGFSWAIITPFFTMIIFTFVFNNLAGIEDATIPYPLFAYTALVPWNLFASGLTYSATSIVSNSELITRMYFPRLLAPLAKQFSGAADMGVAFVILLGLMGYYGYFPTWRIVLIPLLVLMAMAAALGVGMILATIHVRFRDIGPAVPFLVQLWLYLTPVAYPASLVDPSYQALYSLNPMVSVCEGFRWALLGTSGLDATSFAVSSCITLAIFMGGLLFFQQMEGSFPDFV